MKTFLLRRSALLTVFAALGIGLTAACDPKPEVPAKPAATPAVTHSPVTSPTGSPFSGVPKGPAGMLVGRWNGPEGTYLTITEKSTPTGANSAPKKYTVEIKDLDKAETFEGTANGDVIEFTRKGKTESIKVSSGVETGMKGFEKETNCVVVTKGSEGFCKKP